MPVLESTPHIRDVDRPRRARGLRRARARTTSTAPGPGVEYGYYNDGLAAGMKLLGALRADEMIADAKAAIAWLRTRKDVRGDRIGAMGFCIGGHMTYLTACETDVRAAASFYGGGHRRAGGTGRRAVHGRPHAEDQGQARGACSAARTA